MIQSDSGRPLMDGLFPVHRVPKVHNKSAIHRHSLPVDGAFLIWQDKGVNLPTQTGDKSSLVSKTDHMAVRLDGASLKRTF